MANSNTSDLIRPKEAAAHLNMHLATLYRLSDRHENFPKKIKLGARLCYYRRSDLDAWLASREV
jgi:prophage regulatory protein